MFMRQWHVQWHVHAAMTCSVTCLCSDMFSDMFNDDMVMRQWNVQWHIPAAVTCSVTCLCSEMFSDMQQWHSCDDSSPPPPNSIHHSCGEAKFGITALQGRAIMFSSPPSPNSIKTTHAAKQNLAFQPTSVIDIRRQVSVTGESLLFWVSQTGQYSRYARAIYMPQMTVCLVIFLPKLLYTQRV